MIWPITWFRGAESGITPTSLIGILKRGIVIETALRYAFRKPIITSTLIAAIGIAIRDTIAMMLGPLMTTVALSACHFIVRPMNSMRFCSRARGIN